MDMNQLLESIYASSGTDSSLEKTAESAFLRGIDTAQAPEPAAENPFDSMSLEELIKLANDLEAEEVAEAAEVEEAAETEETVEAVETEKEASEEVQEEPAVSEDDEAELNKTAAAMFGGQLMAHAVVHELGLIKEAVANGICRVCKTNHMDVEGSSICSACTGEN